MYSMYMDNDMGEQRERQFWTITPIITVRSFSSCQQSAGRWLASLIQNQSLLHEDFPGHHDHGPYARFTVQVSSPSYYNVVVQSLSKR